MFLDISILGYRPILIALGLILLSGLYVFCTRLYTARMIFVELKRQGLAMPPHSFLFGHLKVFDEVGKTMPSDCHGHVFIKEIRRAYTDLPNTFYLDLWPFGEQMLVTASSEIAHQFTQEHSLPKFEFLKEFLAPLVGQTSLVTMEATELNKAGDI